MGILSLTPNLIDYSLNKFQFFYELLEYNSFKVLKRNKKII